MQPFVVLGHVDIPLAGYTNTKSRGEIRRSLEHDLALLEIRIASVFLALGFELGGTLGDLLVARTERNLQSAGRSFRRNIQSRPLGLGGGDDSGFHWSNVRMVEIKNETARVGLLRIGSCWLPVRRIRDRSNDVWMGHDALLRHRVANVVSVVCHFKLQVGVSCCK